MGETHTRKQNTNWGSVNLRGIIYDGEELREYSEFRQPQDLRDYQKRIETWLEKAASEIRNIYENQALVSQYCSPPNIQLDDVIWSDAIKVFKDLISKRIEGFNNLISNTDW